jgi:hypothetical protein
VLLAADARAKSIPVELSGFIGTDLGMPALKQRNAGRKAL